MWSRRHPAPLRFVYALVVAACLGGCGSPSGPSGIPPWLPAGTVLTFTSGDTGLPVSGATVTVGATPPHTTDSVGRVTLRTAIASSAAATLTVSHPAYLERKTYLRTPDETSFTLWPNVSPTGADAAYAARLVYTPPYENAPVGAPLRRIRAGTTIIAITPSDDIRNDPQALSAHQTALPVATAATEGRITFGLDNASPGAIVVRTATDETACAGDLACAQLDTSNLYITGGRIVFRDIEMARQSGIVLHELGHVLGFSHSGTPGDVMFVPASWEQIRARERFSSREMFILPLMYQRRAGNRWPDDDHGVAASSSAGRHTEVISCDFGGR